MKKIILFSKYCCIALFALFVFGCNQDVNTKTNEQESEFEETSETEENEKNDAESEKDEERGTNKYYISFNFLEDNIVEYGCEYEGTYYGYSTYNINFKYEIDEKDKTRVYLSHNELNGKNVEQYIEYYLNLPYLVQKEINSYETIELALTEEYKQELEKQIRKMFAQKYKMKLPYTIAEYPCLISGKDMEVEFNGIENVGSFFSEFRGSGFSISENILYDLNKIINGKSYRFFVDIEEDKFLLKPIEDNKEDLLVKILEPIYISYTLTNDNVLKLSLNEIEYEMYFYKGDLGFGVFQFYR